MGCLVERARGRRGPGSRWWVVVGKAGGGGLVSGGTLGEALGSTWEPDRTKKSDSRIRFSGQARRKAENKERELRSGGEEEQNGRELEGVLDGPPKGGFSGWTGAEGGREGFDQSARRRNEEQTVG
ncbi:uncharacterized protein BO80DRAFT_180667 [Aspergillus ibericus CBS 121593]|uniref:Uncharacterized protein n=1 Tax=Aspergillus ibericus CBS 121593 TaxID=1448316 RepID=A0A395GSV6_9EURO|nr:hypothetical protein BO80DRAFT_180667 [Aspergillus ibericus CBS 121593]RAK97777.1 hypothetical protein BO80DRAFT_180667 [Aspergillus ibericus CBS 121593]